jgi:hypothetical protein
VDAESLRVPTYLKQRERILEGLREAGMHCRLCERMIELEYRGRRALCDADLRQPLLRTADELDANCTRLYNRMVVTPSPLFLLNKL